MSGHRHEAGSPAQVADTGAAPQPSPAYREHAGLIAALQTLMPWLGGMVELTKGPQAGQHATFCIVCGSDARVLRDGDRVSYRCLGQSVPAGEDLDGVMRPAIRREPCAERDMRAVLREAIRGA